MSWIEDLQKLVPWVSHLPLIPKIAVSLITLSINVVFLALVWAPPRKPATDPRVIES
jgi:hypothetical protein